MRVLVSGMGQSGGTENIIMNYYERISHEDIQFDFIGYRSDIAYSEQLLSNGSKIYTVPSRRENLLEHNKQMDNFFLNNAVNYDALWSNQQTLSDIDTLKYGTKHGIKRRILHSHASDNFGSKLTLMLHKAHKNEIHKYATDYWACSDKAAQWMFPTEVYDEKLFSKIYNAVDFNKFKFNTDIREQKREELNITDEFVIGHVASFLPVKNHEYMLSVFSKYLKRNNNSKLLIIGTGDKNRLEALTKLVMKLNITDHVIFTGSRSDVNELYQAMDLLVLPSLSEGLPVVTIEAQISGLPCIISDNISKEVDITGNVKFVPIGNSNTEKWVSSIEKVELHKDRHITRESVETYDIDKQAIRLEKIFLDML